jgi:hypothetical protein
VADGALGPAARPDRGARVRRHRASAPALRGALHEPRRPGGLCAPGHAPAYARARRVRAAGAHVRARRARAARARAVHDERARVDRARGRHVGLDGRRRRPADAALGRAGGDRAVPRRPAGEVPRRSGDLLLPAGGRIAAELGSRRRERDARSRETRTGNRHRRCDRPLRPPARTGLRGRRSRVVHRDGPAAVSRPAALRRRADQRSARRCRPPRSRGRPASPCTRSRSARRAARSARG